MKLSSLTRLRFLLLTSWVGGPAVGILLWVTRGILVALTWFVAGLVLNAVWGRLTQRVEGAFVQRWQERTEADDPELAKEIQRRFEAGRTDIALPFSLAATYLVSFAGRLALPYALGWTCYVVFGGA